MIFICRHGQTEANAARRVQGHSDAPLTALGERQVRALGAHLAGRGIDRLYASPLGRTRRTAAAAAKRTGLTPVFDDRLMEIACGVLEDLPMDEVEARHPGLWDWRMADRWNRRWPEGESYVY